MDNASAKVSDLIRLPIYSSGLRDSPKYEGCPRPNNKTENRLCAV